MSRGRKAALLLSAAAALAIATGSRAAHAQPTQAQGAATAVVYTLDVDSDAPELISFDALAARIASDLGAPVVRQSETPPRAAITIRYRQHELVVRAVHSGGRVLERTVTAEGDDAAIQREAVLLASNLAREEAREILDELAARPPAARPEPVPSQPAPKPESTPEPPEDSVIASAAVVYPLATNAGRPNVTSSFDISLLYGRVGKIEGAQLGSFIGHASRDVIGAQLTGAASISGGNVSGSQLAGAGNLAQGTLDGLQISGAFNFARGSVAGAQITGALNIAARDLSGAQLAPINIAEETTGLQLGLVNVGRKVHGLQLGLVNIAEDVDGAAIGLVSISKDSIHPIAWTSNLEYLNAGIKFTTKYVFTIAAVHYGTHEGDFDNVGVTGGLGAHIPLPSSFDVELQGSVTQLIPRPSQKRLNGNVWIAPQVAAGYTFAPHLRAFAGGGARLPVSVDLGRDVVRPEVLAGIQF